MYTKTQNNELKRSWYATETQSGRSLQIRKRGTAALDALFDQTTLDFNYGSFGHFIGYQNCSSVISTMRNTRGYLDTGYL